MDYQALKTELLAGHPDTGAYNADNSIAATQINAVNRPASGGINEMLLYLIVNRNRSNDGTDTTQTAILGRLRHVADADVGVDVFGRGAGNEVTLEQKHAAQMFLTLIQSPQVSSIDLLDTEVDNAYSALGAGANGARVWRPADITALKGLSENQQSRAAELGFGRVRIGDVEYARSI